MSEILVRQQKMVQKLWILDPKIKISSPFLTTNLWIFELNDAQVLFGMFQGFKKATPYGRARNLRLS